MRFFAGPKTATTVYNQYIKEPQAEKSDEARAAEAFNFIFGSNKSAYHMRDREVMSKMLTSMLASLQENDIVAEQEKNHVCTDGWL